MPAAMSADSGASDATHLRSTSVLPASVLLRRFVRSRIEIP